MRGTLLKGREAEYIGLVNQSVAAPEVLATGAADRAGTRRRADVAIRWTKLSINQIVRERVNHLLEASWRFGR
jgi:enoyl-CoA hydratase/carnithine racemase